MMRVIPQTWPATVKFLCEEQRRIERLRMAASGMILSAGEIDLVCLQYAAQPELPILTENAKNGLLQRLEWARLLAATLLHSFRMADGTKVVHTLQCPGWTFETLMIWFLIDTWQMAEKFSSLFPRPLPPRQEPPSLLGWEAN